MRCLIYCHLLPTILSTIICHLLLSAHLSVWTASKSLSTSGVQPRWTAEAVHPIPQICRSFKAPTAMPGRTSSRRRLTQSCRRSPVRGTTWYVSLETGLVLSRRREAGVVAVVVEVAIYSSSGHFTVNENVWHHLWRRHCQIGEDWRESWKLEDMAGRVGEIAFW